MLSICDTPNTRHQEGFASRADSLGHKVVISTAGELMASFEAIENKDPQAHMALQLLARKAMVKAKYFCTGMLDIARYRHYALNVPMYTHFTSPIRRYADVMVHRQLDAILAGGQFYFLKPGPHMLILSSCRYAIQHGH